MKDIIIDIVSEILGTTAERNKTLEWSRIDQYSKLDIVYYKDLFSKVYRVLGADYSKIRKIWMPYFPCDAYFNKPYNFIFEYDTLIYSEAN
jgi:hypothetical protein